MPPTPPLILLAAGGTGGHVFPAQALAAALLARGWRVALMTDGRGMKMVGSFDATLAAMPVYPIAGAGLGSSLRAKLRGVAAMGVGLVNAYRKIRHLKPAAMVGFGGYPAVPPLLAAKLCGVPILLHEQNAVAGRANQFLARLATTIATSFPQVRGFKAGTTLVVTGNPVRPAICALYNLPYPVPGASITLLVMGGSLGATVLSQVVPAAIALLPRSLQQRLVINQQCRAEDVEKVREAYAKAGVQAEVAAFFHDVPARLAACHLAICRSGASTVAELCAAGRPALFVPYPHAVTGEQQANAEAVVARGGGWLLPESAFTAPALAEQLATLLDNPNTLVAAATAAKSLARLDAAEALAEAVAVAIKREKTAAT